MLARYSAIDEDQEELARDLIERMVHREMLRDPMLDWRVIPASSFSGDQITGYRSPAGPLYLMMADATGHGLAAAITLMPVLPVFYSMARKDLSVAEMVVEMNHKLREFLPVGRFLALLLARHDPARREISYWNGGMPAGLLLDARGHALRELPASQPALGVLASDEFDGCSESIDVPETGAALFYSDGLIESQNIEREPFGSERLRQCIIGPGDQIVSRVLHGLERHVAGQPLTDDVSLAAIRLGDLATRPQC